MYPANHDVTTVALPEPLPELLRRLHTSEQWRIYFRHNADGLLPVAWHEGAALTPEERQTIYRSIRQFQLGENSEGNHLRRLAQAYAARTGDTAYAEAMNLFIQEEQRHARDLGLFMYLAGIPRAASHWSDSVFRGLRKLSNLEMMLSVLLTAELIAKVYYVALRDATACPLLRRICGQILRDEREHVHFHVERLARLRATRRGSLDLVHLLFGLFIGGACVVAWMGNAAVFKRAGMIFGGFWSACQLEVREAVRRMDPRLYCAIASATTLQKGGEGERGILIANSE